MLCSLLILALSLNQRTGRPTCPWATKTQSVTGRRSSLKVVIFRNAPSRIKKLIAAQFPKNWEIVTVSADEFENAIGDAQVIIPEGTAIDRRVLALAPGLKFIQTGAGYDNIDIDACTERGIYVANAAGVNARAVAEHVFAFILAWYKNIIALDGTLKRGGFSVDYAGSELSQK